MQSENITGHWWLPSNPERRVAGNLTYSGDGFPELDLMEALTEDRESADRTIVLGLSGEATPVTIEVDFETNRSASSTRQGHMVTHQTLAVARAFVGAHLANEGDRQFKRMSVTYSDVLAWTGWHGPRDDWSEGIHSIRFVEPDELSARPPWGQLHLRHSWAIGGDGVSDRSIRVGAGFLCERPSSASAIAWLSDVVAPLRDFVTLATDRANQVEEITFEWAEGEPYVRFIYAPTSVELPPKTAYWFDFPFTATGLGDSFDGTISRWFTNRRELAPAFDLYLSTQYRRSTQLENRFLNIVGAAEAYHRRAVPTPPEALEKHNERLDRILNAVEGRRDRDWLSWKLRYAYEPSFGERLQKLAERANDVLGPWLGDAQELAKRVSDARNILVHRDPSHEAKRPDGRSLLDAMEDVALIFLVCVYQDLGFDNAAIRDMLSRTRRWQFLMFRKRGWRD